jgi:endo-1,4-beta-xylanase
MKLFLTIIAGALLAFEIRAAEPLTLKAAFKDDFLVGAALNPSQFCESNAMEAAIVKAQFNTISPENVLKWGLIHPLPEQYDFTLADKYVEFGLRNKMFIVGHNLVWHSQTPDWVFENYQGKPLTRDQLLARMHEHIFTVVGRYKGKINGWDVVNEAVEENGKMRRTPWRKIIGKDYLVKAFQFAHEADPQAELYYNDYGLENPTKRAGALALVKQLQAAGVKITGVGLQGHYQLATNSPTLQEVDDTITAFARLGVKVMVTELDVDVLPSAWKALSADVSLRAESDAKLNPYPNALPESVQDELAVRYAALFKVFLKHRDVIERVTLWGVTDSDSWLNDWPVHGRTAYPLLFDREGKPKPACQKVLAVPSNKQVVTINPTSASK